MAGASSRRVVTGPAGSPTKPNQPFTAGNRDSASLVWTCWQCPADGQRHWLAAAVDEFRLELKTVFLFGVRKRSSAERVLELLAIQLFPTALDYRNRSSEHGEADLMAGFSISKADEACLKLSRERPRRTGGIEPVYYSADLPAHLAWWQPDFFGHAVVGGTKLFQAPESALWQGPRSRNSSLEHPAKGGRSLSLPSGRDASRINHSNSSSFTNRTACPKPLYAARPLSSRASLFTWLASNDGR